MGDAAEDAERRAMVEIEEDGYPAVAGSFAREAASAELLEALEGITDVDVQAIPRSEAALAEDAQIVEAVSTEIALPNGVVVDTMQIDQVVTAIKDLDMLKAQVAAARRRLVEAVMEHRTITGSAATMSVSGSTVTITTAKEIEWDMEELGKLRDAGLPESTWDELVVTTVSEKVNANVAKRIQAANPDYAKIITAARTDHEKNPTVTVK